MVIQDVARMYMEYYLTIKKCICRNMDGPQGAVILSEVSQMKDKSRMIELICGRKKKSTNELICKTELQM